MPFFFNIDFPILFYALITEFCLTLTQKLQLEF